MLFPIDSTIDDIKTISSEFWLLPKKSLRILDQFDLELIDDMKIFPLSN